MQKGLGAVLRSLVKSPRGHLGLQHPSFLSQNTFALVCFL